MNALIRFLSGVKPQPAPGGKFRREGYLCIAAPDAELPPDFPAMKKPDHTVKDSRSVTAFRCENGRIFAKIYKVRNLAHALKYVFRTPRAFRCFAAAEALKKAGFATPEAAAAAVRYRFGVPTCQILLTEALPQNTVFLDRELAAATSLDAARTLLRKLAVFAAKLHLAGFLHGDLSLRNIYRVPDDRQFGLIDLDSLLLSRKPFLRTAAIGELARIVSNASRLRPDLPRDLCMTEVLREYHAAGGMELRPEELAPVIRRLAKHRPPAPARH